MTEAPLAAWIDALDALDERLRRQEAFLDGVAGPPPALDLPAPAGRLPDELAPRAALLLHRNDQLLARAAEAIGRLRPRPSSPYSA